MENTIVFGLTLSMITPASFSRERRKPFLLPLSIKQFLEYIDVPRRLLFILITLNTFKISGFVLLIVVNLKG